MLSKSPLNSLNQQVTVTSAARLHMGFFDLSNNTECRFGGLGLAIDAPCIQVQLSESQHLVIDANCSENITNIVENIIKSFNLPRGFCMQMLQSIPVHVGRARKWRWQLASG
jgi:beta-ribofuranosylaminobenzene 5'-phosphate synthase